MPAKKNTTKSAILAFSLPVEKIADIERRARSLNITKAAYARIVLEDWLASGKGITLTEK